VSFNIFMLIKCAFVGHKKTLILIYLFSDINKIKHVSLMNTTSDNMFHGSEIGTFFYFAAV
jgi:hypothetical protein